MWLFTPDGFYSIVQKPGHEYLTVRSRVASDLDILREKFMPTLSATDEGTGTDYRFRATIGHAAFAEGLAMIGHDIHYDNFKNEVARVKGPERAMAYGYVWQALIGLEHS